jgi:hypothetical protein
LDPELDLERARESHRTVASAMILELNERPKKHFEKKMMEGPLPHFNLPAPKREPLYMTVGQKGQGLAAQLRF